MIGRRKTLMLAALAAAALFTAPAQACLGSQLHRYYLHDTLTDAVEGEVAARVEIVRSNWPTRGKGRFEAEARIIEVLRGTFPGSRIKIGPATRMTNCDRPPVKGRTGILVGKIVSVKRNVVTLLPTPTKTDYQLYLEAEKPGEAK